MDKATKFVLIPFRDFRLLTCKRKINSKGRISGIVKEIELSDDENEIKKSKGASRFVLNQIFNSSYFQIRRKKELRSQGLE